MLSGFKQFILRGNVVDLAVGVVIGAAFAHQNGEGYNVILQALPIPNGDGQCKIVLRPPKKDEENDQRSQEREDRNNKPGSRRR